MENSFNSSSPESSVSDKKSIFRKQTNFHETFEVSMEESVTVVENNKSDQVLDVSPKVLPFKKTRASIPHSFSITSDDSLATSQTEESVTFKIPSIAFLKKNKSLIDSFNVSFNETNVSRQDVCGKSFDDSNTVYNKTNPFKKRNESQIEIQVGNESSVAESEKESSNLSPNFGELQKQIVCNLDEGDDDDSSTILTKQNPFRTSKKQNEHTATNFELSAVDEDKTEENVVESQTRDGDESSTLLTKQNPFRISKAQREPTTTNLELSVMAEDKSVENGAVKPATVRNGDESSTLLTKENAFGMLEQEERDSLTHLQLSGLDKNKSVENEAEPEIQRGDESQLAVSSTENDKSTVSLKRSQKRSMSETDFNEPDSTTCTTKQNPFKKSANRDSLTQMQLSITNNSLGNRTNEMQSQASDDTDMSAMKTKSNPFKQKKSLQSENSMISVTEERSKENLLQTSSARSHNLSVDRSVLKSANNTASYFEQSSINDENLNHWMSDQSDEEIAPPRTPTVNANGNLSATKEKPAISSPTKTLSVWEQKLNEIMSNAESRRKAAKLKTKTPQKPKPQFKRSDQNVQKAPDTYKPPKLIKPAPFATKTLYNHIIKKLEPKYGIDAVIESENLVSSICDAVKKVNRKKTHQKKLIQNLKKEMAEAGLIETTMDFYEFVIKFLPYSFRVKVVPCLQPVTNIVYPPKDVMNPFDKIL